MDVTKKLETYEDMIAYLKYCVYERNIDPHLGIFSEDDGEYLRARYRECHDISDERKIELYNMIVILYIQSVKPIEYNSFAHFLKSSGTSYRRDTVTDGYKYRITNHNGCLTFISQADDINEAMEEVWPLPWLSAYDEAIETYGADGITTEILAEFEESYQKQMVVFNTLKSMFTLKQLSSLLNLHGCGDRI